MPRRVYFSIDGPFAKLQFLEAHEEITPDEFLKSVFSSPLYSSNFEGTAVNQIRLLDHDRQDIDVCTDFSLFALGLGHSKMTPVFFVIPVGKLVRSFDSLSSPIDRFLALLAKAGSFTVSEDTMTVLKFKLFNALPNIKTPTEALQLFTFAEQYPHRTTVDRFEKQQNLIIDGSYTPMSATSAKIIHAYRSDNGAPKLLKFGSTSDYNTYLTLGLDCESAQQHHIVHIEEQIKDAHGKTAIVMKPYPGVLESVPHLPAVLVLRGVQQMLTALTYLHSKKIAHCDVKTGNILLDELGNWFLCDLGSAVAFDHPETILPTAGYVPLDAKVEATAAFDKLLLAVAAVTVVNPVALDLASRFSMSALRCAVESIKVYSPELYEALLELLPLGTCN